MIFREITGTFLTKTLFLYRLRLFGGVCVFWKRLMCDNFPEIASRLPFIIIRLINTTVAFT